MASSRRSARLVSRSDLTWSVFIDVLHNCQFLGDGYLFSYSPTLGYIQYLPRPQTFKSIESPPHLSSVDLCNLSYIIRIGGKRFELFESTIEQSQTLTTCDCVKQLVKHMLLLKVKPPPKWLGVTDEHPSLWSVVRQIMRVAILTRKGKHHLVDSRKVFEGGTARP